jgi:rod shape-determining protein MreC
MTRPQARGSAAGRPEIRNLTADSRIKPGELVLTSGGDQVYPRGLPVGAIERIAPDPDHQPYTAIVVHPAADLDRVEEVLVITGTQSNLPPDAQQDLTAAEAQHAADLSAERLPGIHDDETPGAANTPNGTAPSTPAAPATAVPPPLVLPHPPPTLHSDRFTTGSTPPASSLTPGSPITPLTSQPTGGQQPPPKPAEPK